MLKQTNKQTCVKQSAASSCKIRKTLQKFVYLVLYSFPTLLFERTAGQVIFSIFVWETTSDLACVAAGLVTRDPDLSLNAYRELGL